jgi:hypothetical protein
MAQDVIAPQSRSEKNGTWVGVAASLLHRLDLPKSPALPPVDYTLPLVAYVVSTYVAAGSLAVVAWLWLPVTHDVPTLAAGGVTIFLMSLYAIRQRPPSNTTWTPTTFVHLGLSVALGPVGCLVGAVAESTGVLIRSRNGLFRTFFNMSNHYLANMSAWAVFTWIDGGTTNGQARDLIAGVAAGFAHFVVNSGFVALVRIISDPSVPIGRFMRARFAVMPYSIAYGFAAFTFVVMYGAHTGWVGFIALLAPIIVLHAYLIFFERGTYEHEQQRLAFQRDREALLRKEAEASERERTKIAGDLHDGVVQNLAGMAFALSAEASHIKARTVGVGDARRDEGSAHADHRSRPADTSSRGAAGRVARGPCRDQAQGNQHETRPSGESPSPQGPRRADLPRCAGSASQRGKPCSGEERDGRAHHRGRGRDSQRSG